VRFAFIEAEKANYPITVLCTVLKVSRSGFFAWRCRPPSARSKADVGLSVALRAAFSRSRETYGSPRLRAELRDKGFPVGRRRVMRLMRANGIVARPARRFRRTTQVDARLPVAPNVLARNFNMSAPNLAWVTDITYVPTWEGWLYLAVIIDVFSRRVVGWAAAEHMREQLVLEALRMAIGRRIPGSNLVHHSDRGSQYASHNYRGVLEQHGIVCSMSRKGDCWDNAVVESFFSGLKTELVYRHAWRTRDQARHAIGEWIERFYNPHRRHSALGYLSPAHYERLHREAARAA
jgi:transposase InsO family protein